MTTIINYLKRKNGSGHIVEHIGWHESGDYMLRGLFGDGVGYRSHKFDTEKDLEVIDKSEIDALEIMTCGRFVASAYDSIGKHFWATRPNGDRTCSYCGSLHPDDVIRIVKNLGIGCIGSTTKSYKWYIRQPSVKNACEGGIKYYRHHDTPDFIEALEKWLDV